MQIYLKYFSASPSPRIAATTTVAAAKRTTRMTRRMARIASTAGGAGRITAATTAVMHKLRDDDGLHDDLATMLADVGFFLLSVS